MEEDESDEVIHSIEATDLDAHTAEALELEIRRLAKRYGVVIQEFRKDVVD